MMKELKCLPADRMISSVRLYATNDGKIVREGDPRASSLIAPAGVEIDAKIVKKYDLANAVIDDHGGQKVANIHAKTAAPEAIHSRKTRVITPETR